jgi:protein-tyrosine phosphatase
MKKILFICTANICRSPAAEAIFNALAGDREMNARAKSAGVAALEGREIAPETAAALEEIGVYAGEHRASQVSREIIEGADLVLTMNGRQVEKARSLMGNLPEYVHVLPEYATGVPGSSIPDPYGYTMPAHRATVRQLLEYVEIILDRLEK